ncbi:iron uptake transporter permease EfeU [Curtobacterium sp. RRHDQ10]|uniref:iron uptake transporter permease EfeU n=1 Tax=Curtobacterium phyllosphaerae TaxID=3413379 RepID=UPI003BF29079
MLATLVIGLREGLEATLIVGIIAAFLRRNRIPLAPMWLGVGVAVLLSIGVGVGLQVVEQALPQAQQEAMEAVIGVVAVVFVTGMILWMRGHARSMRAELESSASAAVGTGTAWALAGMAFLAVLKEGFETSVFLLATFQASSDTALAALGAVVGVLVAVGIGYGIYTGGVRLDLSRFFAGTGVFLVFVAGGLVLTVLRRAHEAGWIVIGQQGTVDLSWLAPNGSVQGALVTGVLGIPPDPRVIEVLGWLAYVVPVLLITVWPNSRRPSAAALPRIRIGFAAVFALAAVVLAVAVPTGHADVPTTVAVRPGAGDGGSTDPFRVRAEVDGDSATLVARGRTTTLPASAHMTTVHDGVEADRWRTSAASSTAGRPTTMSVDDLATLFGRVPVGVSPSQNPGPYAARWSSRATTTLWSVDGGVLDAQRVDRTVLTLSGGGLPTTRTYSVTATDWAVPSATAQRTAAAVADAARASREAVLWRTWLPLALGVAAVTQLVLTLRDRRRARRPVAAPTTPTTPEPHLARVDTRSPTHAVR